MAQMHAWLQVPAHAHGRVVIDRYRDRGGEQAWAAGHHVTGVAWTQHREDGKEEPNELAAKQARLLDMRQPLLLQAVLSVAKYHLTVRITALPTSTHDTKAHHPSCVPVGSFVKKRKPGPAHAQTACIHTVWRASEDTDHRLASHAHRKVTLLHMLLPGHTLTRIPLSHTRSHSHMNSHQFTLSHCHMHPHQVTLTELV